MRILLAGTCVALVAAAFLVPLHAGAQGYVQPSIPRNISDLGSFKDNILCVALFWVFTIALILGIGFLFYAGIKYITSAGNKETVSEAHRVLVWAIVGIAVAILARGVPFIVARAAGATYQDPCGRA